MSNGFLFPPAGFGPGSQPLDDEELSYMALPSGMRTYVPHLPEVGDPSQVTPALKTLADIAGACEIAATAGGERAEFDLSAMDPASRALMAETLGQGEVSMKLRGVPALMVQESVFAGVWMLAGAGIDRIEVGPVPAEAVRRAHGSGAPAPMLSAPRPAGVVNAPALLAELADQSANWRSGGMPHVVNLSLLPHTEEDLLWLDAALGKGAVTILSRGYGNCRIGACALPQVWRVQFFNSMDTLILDTFEVTAIPEVALAAPEDLADSGERIREVLEAIR
ncbi:hydrogenase accessory protein HypB [Pannonibacter phragmitetus]|uniref:hydrogenase expression/formation protein n=1 Tax=Pannonibacter phragmitetus TaxID=121719 RepID=UPI00067E5E45|nr:hydrogenase expression/formation protein [Pannonibacter phragmitetus]KND17164.1 hydrogenase accessory protein HypB [Pannonibacter phragmitetus]